MTQSATEILKRPYRRVLIREADGRFSAEIAEFPGCVAFGDDRNSALDNLEEVAVDWIDATLEQGQSIPEPTQEESFSGKLVLRMPRSLHRRASAQAEHEGVSLNQFIVARIAEAVGARTKLATGNVMATAYKPFADLVVNVLNVGQGQASWPPTLAPRVHTYTPSYGVIGFSGDETFPGYIPRRAPTYG